jgi:hypothetical protein
MVTKIKGGNLMTQAEFEIIKEALGNTFNAILQKIIIADTALKNTKKESEDVEKEEKEKEEI